MVFVGGPNDMCDGGVGCMIMRPGRVSVHTHFTIVIHREPLWKSNHHYAIIKLSVRLDSSDLILATRNFCPTNQSKKQTNKKHLSTRKHPSVEHLYAIQSVGAKPTRTLYGPTLHVYTQAPYMARLCETGESMLRPMPEYYMHRAQPVSIIQHREFDSYGTHARSLTT